MRVLGVDPGSRLCGYGVLDVHPSGSYTYVECGTLSADAKGPMEDRLGNIARWLTDVVNELKPEVLAVEEVFSHINTKSALALAQARGMVLAVAGMAGIPVCSYSPTMIKKTVTGRGRAPKEQVALMVQGLLNLKNTPSADAADALAIAITHVHHQATEKLKRQVQK